MLLNNEALKKALEMTLALTQGIGEDNDDYSQRITDSSTKLVKGIRDQNFRPFVAELLLKQLIYPGLLKSLEYRKLKRLSWILGQSVTQNCFSQKQLKLILLSAKLTQSSCPEVTTLISLTDEAIAKGVWYPNCAPEQKGEIWSSILARSENYDSVRV